MDVSKSAVLGFVGAALFLFVFSSAVSAQDADGRSLVERSGGWDSYVRQEGDYNSAVFEAALPSQNPKTPYSLVIGKLYPNCDRSSVTYYLAPAAEEKVGYANLKGTMKAGERSFEVTYKVESPGDGVFTVTVTNFNPELIAAMLEAPSVEIALPNLGDFSVTASLDGFPEAWARAGLLCGRGEGVRLF